ncbi:ENTP8 diphosphohydrolase, partial [Pygoscelis papua]
GLAFDAGSTHTALYVYRWPADKENGTGIISQVEACTVSGECAGTCLCLSPSLLNCCPRLSQHHAHQASGGQGLGDRAEGVPPPCCAAVWAWKLIPLWSPCAGSPWVMPGAGQCSFTGKWTHLPAEDVVGALDLSGASTQIAFLPGTTIGDSRTRALLRLYGTTYSIYTHSYLCYGQKQALKMLMAASHQGSSSPQRISHPCHPKGYQENITTADLYDSPCVHAPSTPSPAQVLTVTGTGEPAACSTAIQKLFNFTCGANRTCGFNGVYQPPVRGQFFVRHLSFSGLHHNLHFLKLTGGQSLSSVNATIGQFCTSSWEKVQKEFPTTNRTHLRDACAASSYALTLLLQGYKFNHTTWLNIHFVWQVANIDAGWTLGYMLNLTNVIPSETPQRVTGLQRSNWIAATVLLAIMLILIFCLLTVICCQKNFSGYESL